VVTALTPAMAGMGPSPMSFDPTLVALSFGISVFGSLSGLQSARHARRRTGTASFGWLTAAALSIGGGAIWSMHFIGMLAYQSDVHYAFDTRWTLLSLFVAVTASGTGLYVAGRGEPTLARYVGAGTITGLGVAGMHYLGMSAMRMNATLTYRPLIVLLSLVIAVVAASVALFFAFTLTKMWAIGAASVAMGIGICGMHYTGMAAAIITPRVTTDLSAPSGVDPLTLALPVFGIAAVLLFVLLFVGLFEDADAPAPVELVRTG
jgi:NO-binding membrane sensor protein with MHYT domain